MSFLQLANLERINLTLKVYIMTKFREFYPNGVRAPHLFGYVKEVDRVIRKDLKNKELYELGDLVGWSGLEKHYESFLRGKEVRIFMKWMLQAERLALQLSLMIQGLVPVEYTNYN